MPSKTTTLGDLLHTERAGTITEREWVRVVAAVAAGDQQALRTLWDRAHRIVFTLALRICGSRELAEEVTVDVFYDLWRRSTDYAPKNGTVVGWIMMQTRSTAIDRMRFEQRKKRTPPSAQLDDCGDGGPADAVDLRQQQSQLEAALTALTPDERQAIETAFFSELTYSETAARLDQPLGTVKTRVRSALAKLRKALERKGGGHD
jgi:RNA polymerase sigma-70 factor, ECF subfamily